MMITISILSTILRFQYEPHCNVSALLHNNEDLSLIAVVKLQPQHSPLGDV